MTPSTDMHHIDLPSRPFFSETAKDRLKIAGVVGLILLGGLVGAATSGAIFSYKATPLLLGGLVGVSATGLSIGIGAFVYQRREREQEEEPLLTANAQYLARQESLESVRLTPQEAKELADAILAIPGLADRLTQTGISRVSPSEQELKALMESYQASKTIDPGTDINLLVGLLKRSYASLNLFEGIAIEAKEPTIKDIAAMLERLPADKRAALSSYIRFFKLMADQQAALRSQEEERQKDLPEAQKRFTAMSLESVAVVSSPVLKQVEVSLAGFQETANLKKMAIFMIANYAELFPLPARS